ncbi:MAG: PhoH family protein [Verrucomicrobia bacterium]|nr:PhoH family protein [Verrucomicrobiota bacterium]
MAEETVHLESPRVAQAIYGNDPRLLKSAEEFFGVKMTQREAWFRVEGAEMAAVRRAAGFLRELESARAKGVAIRAFEFNYALQSFKNAGTAAGGAQGENPSLNLQALSTARIEVSTRKQSINARSHGQRRFVEAMRNADMVFCIGPAGTGKTYLATAMAVSMLREGRVERIVLARPAVEAGEALGFLPGDLKEKLLPYLRPLYDALGMMMEPDEIQRHAERGTIEIAPLAYMRGRTLNHAFIILDEAQNTTSDQMLMFLTRLGNESRCVITGDVTQIDLPSNKRSGLVEAERVLKDVLEAVFCHLDETDVVRHFLVQKIIRAYQEYRAKSHG